MNATLKNSCLFGSYDYNTSEVEPVARKENRGNLNATDKLDFFKILMLTFLKFATLRLIS